MKDLTKGNITKLILMFSLPLLLGNVFQLFYNLADTRIVGQTLGKNAIAALGATSSVNTVIIGFLNGLTNGFALVTARFFGAKEFDRLKKSVAHALTLVCNGNSPHRPQPCLYRPTAESVEHARQHLQAGKNLHSHNPCRNDNINVL
ncbi:MAG: MATE family efflux transporter [Ruminococcus bicirculans (ex Wegman et al. 2014)]